MGGLYNMSVVAEARRLTGALGRLFDYDVATMRAAASFSYQHRIVQVCPLCDAALGLWIEIRDASTFSELRRQLFSLYDQHRCVASLDPHTLFERAERALLTAAERIAVIDDPELRARAEHEADRMAERAAELRTRF